jgi:hypothetical protein
MTIPLMSMIAASALALAPAPPEPGCEDLRFEVSEARRALKVGEDAVFTIRLFNEGDRAAVNVRMSIIFSDNLDAMSADGLDRPASYRQASREVTIPLITRVEAGKERVVTLKARAKSAGVATCRVTVGDDDLGATTLVKDGMVRVR